MSIRVDDTVSLKIGRLAHRIARWYVQFYATQWCKTSTYRLCQVGLRIDFAMILVRSLVSCIIRRELVPGILNVRFSTHFIFLVSVCHTTPIRDVYPQARQCRLRSNSYSDGIQQLFPDGLCIGCEINCIKMDQMTLNIHPLVDQIANRRMK